MESFENDIPQEPVPENTQPEPRQEESAAQPDPAPIPEEPAAAQSPAQDTSSSVYHGAGAGRKESPFADSPYVMPNQAGRTYTAGAAPQPSKNPKQRRSVWKPVLAGVLALALVVGSCAITAWIVDAKWEGRTQAIVGDLKDKLADLQQQIDENANHKVPSGNPVVSTGGLTPAQVYSQNIDSVVLVETAIRSGGQVGYSTGSGFVITEDGYIVTNYHVVEDGTSYTVVFSDGSEYPATLQGGDETNDVAVLKIDATGLNPVKIGNSSDLIVGDQVVAIGNPLGTLTSTLTVGYVSGKDRDVSTDGTAINMIQTDAAINSGNSGGPLFNTRGEVVGITTAKYSGESSSGATIEGIGFAIPIDDVKEILVELLENGYVSTPYMGVYIRDTSDGIGVYVESVEPGGSAEAAGVKARDLIVALGDQNTTSISELTRAIRNYKVGDTTTITVFRGRQLIDLKITFAEKPRDDAAAVPSDNQSNVPQDGSYEDWFDFFFGGK